MYLAELNCLSDKKHQIPSIVFVSMLAMLIALCLAADSSSISMEIWYELSLLFLISVSVVVPCKWNTEELDFPFQQPIDNIYCINIVVIIKSALCNVLCFSMSVSLLVRISFLFIEELSGNFVQIINWRTNRVWDQRWFTLKSPAEQNFCSVPPW